MALGAGGELSGDGESVKQLLRFGQSRCVHFLERDLLRSRELATLEQKWRLRGVTSNPAIFESAIDLGAYDAGKPSDTFVGGVDPARALVVEDAVAGEQAGRAGGSGLVVGVARRVAREDLVAACADRVLQVLEETRA